MSEHLYHPLTYKEQFEQPKQIESFGGRAEYVDIKPEISKSNIPVVVASGFSEGRKALAGVGEELFTAGRRALLVDHARDGEAMGGHEKFGNETMQRAETLVKAMNDAGVEQADVVAHSEGVLDIVFAAHSHPERFRSLILAMPAGMIGEDSILKLAGRFAPKTTRSVTKDTMENPGIGFAINTGGMKYIGKHPVKAKREASEIASTTIHDMLVSLREKDIRVGIVQSQGDPVFPAERIEQHVDLSDEATNLDAYASVNREDAGHDELLINPKTVVPSAIQMIEQFYS